MIIENNTNNKKVLSAGVVLEHPSAAVQKSNSLLYLWQSSLTLPEFKILDAYLARIDSHHPENRCVQFSKGELEQILDVDRIRIEVLEKRIEHLGIMVKVEDFEDKRGFRSISLFEEAVCYKDDAGLWQIELTCTKQAMKYIFHIENLGYLRYKLQSIIHLTSRYSYLLFLYLERNRFRQSWETSIDELRAQLGCEDTMPFKYFHNNVLKRSKHELEEKTTCRFSYELIKHGRYVHSVRFCLESLGLNVPTAALEEPSSEELSSTEIEMLRSVCKKPNGQAEFSVAEIQQINEILKLVPQKKRQRIPGVPNSIFSRKQYLAERYASLNRLAEKKPIKHRFNYLLKMIRRDAGLD